jgi:uncharacterized RDD family membrane protein YckC
VAWPDTAEHGWNQRLTDLLLQAVDVNAVARRIDMNAVLDQIDVNELIKRVDLQALLDRVDMNELLRRIDIEALAGETDLGAIIARSSGGMASDALDAVRGQAVGLDEFVDRSVARLARLVRRRRPASRWRGAGAVSRFVAYVIDLAISSSLFTIALAAISYAVMIVTGHPIIWNRHGYITAIASAAWFMAYFGYSWAAGGRTLGMAALGLRVVRAGNADLESWRGVLRAVVFPLSFLLCGLGLAGIVFQRQHRALHDFIAGTAVTYAWDARAARLRSLARPSARGDARRPAGT